MSTTSEIFATALKHHQAGRSDEAATLYRQILAQEPQCADAWHLLGVAAFQLGQIDEAIDCIGRALELNPSFGEAHSNLGVVFFEQGNFNRAASCFQRALQLSPGYPGAYANLGNALREQGSLDEAVACYRAALGIDPNQVEVYFSLGTTLRRQGRCVEAISAYQNVLARKPDHVECLNNLGNAFKDLGRFDEAMDCYHRALQIRPDYADAHFNQAVVMLLRGDFQHGWREFEFRFVRQGSSPRQFAQPQWIGDDLRNKTILLYTEQGLGDSIQFVRYAAVIKLRGAMVVLECQPELVPLFKSLSTVDHLVAKGAELPRFDVHCSLLSLPRILGTTIETIPTVVPYLSVSPLLIDQWKTRLRGLEGLKIGIAWQGNPTYADDRDRSIPLRFFAPLAGIPGVQLISLQKGHGISQIEEASSYFQVFNPGPDLDHAHGAFMDTAAVIKNLDLVITSDTSIPHLAGALGAPVWVALPFVPDWRWLLDRSDSPWYPTMRLFRQKQAGDWAGVFVEIEAALAERVQSSRFKVQS